MIQDRVKRESGEGQERVRRGCRECQRGSRVFEETVQRVRRGSKEIQEMVQ